MMIASDRLEAAEAEAHSSVKKDSIDIIVRKRPIFDKEMVVAG